MKIRLLVLIFSLSWLTTQGFAALKVEINSGYEGAQPIALVPFVGKDASKITDVVMADLNRTGQFKFLPVAQMPQTPEETRQVQYKLWTKVGVEVVIVGSVAHSPTGTAVSFQVLDAIGKKPLTEQETVRSSDVRTAAHRVSDVIYEALTGVKGAFSTKIAFVAYRALGDGKAEYKLKVADSDGYNPFTIVTSVEPILSPSWSPDGNNLAYVSFEGGTPAVYIQNLSTGQRKQLSNEAGVNGAPAWSPDGTKVAMTLSRDGNTEIYLTNTSGQKTRLTHHRAIDTEPTWSPDGSSIYFTSDRSGKPQIYRVSISGGTPHRVTFEGNYNARPSISPDGKKMAVVHSNGGGFSIAVQDLENGGFVELTPAGRFETPSFSPNGMMVLFASGAGTLGSASVDGRAQTKLSAQAGAVREPAWSPFR